MKILQIITELGGGGAEKMLRMLAEGLKETGHTVTVLSLCAPPREQTIPDQLRAAGISVEYLHARKSDPFLLLKLRQKIKRIAPDIVHSHLMHPNLLSRLACATLKIPVINTVHTLERRRGKKFYFFLDRLTARLAFITAVSASAAAYHERKCRLKPGSIKVIRNAVEPVEPAPAEFCRDFLKPYLPKGGADRIIGSLGRLDAMKGYDVMLDRLDALSRLIPDGEKWLILILGDGPDREKLEEKAAALHYDNLKVKFAGFQTNAAPLMNSFDVFFTPSLCEGYGLAVAEAMTLGLPIVANDIDALSELCRMYDGDAFLFNMKKDDDGENMALELLKASECDRSSGMIVMEKQKMVRAYSHFYSLIRKKFRKKT